MAVPRLEVRDALGERVVALDKMPFLIGRRETNALRLGGSEVSQLWHPEREAGAFHDAEWMGTRNGEW